MIYDMIDNWLVDDWFVFYVVLHHLIFFMLPFIGSIPSR
jgi:hypothetical protein